MRKSLLLLMTTALLFPGLASAQTPQAPKPGDYEFVSINVFEPDENVPPGQVARTPSLAAASGQIRVAPGGGDD